MTRERTCENCGGDMQLVDRIRQTYRPDLDQMTEGQLAEQLAAEMGGAFEEGIHGETISIYQCAECDAIDRVSAV